MSIKIYRKNNFVVVDEDNSSIKYLASQKADFDDVEDSGFVVWNVDNSKEVYSFMASELQDEDGVAVGDKAAVLEYLSSNINFKTGVGSSTSSEDDGKSGYSRTSAFTNGSETYTQADVDAGIFKVFSLNEANHLANDNPYWSTPTPSGVTGIGLFQGANLPEGVSSLVDYSYDYDTAYPGSNGTGFEGSTGRLKLNDCKYGDLIKVRFDFNVIPQIANTTVEPALWYSNRNDSDDITFTFPLTAQPIFYGGGTVGKTYLNRVEISAWITSNEDVNALTLPAIKADNPIIIEPIGILITLIR